MDEKIISNIKSLAIDMIDKAGSGHPGIVLGAAPIIYTIYAKHMNINTTDSRWISRDRFVMSAGHGSALLYATLYMAGFNIGMEDLKHFRRIGYKTPGHPEYGVTPGVDMTTGPLGQGIATCVGLALGEKMIEKKFKIPSESKIFIDKSLVNYNVYALVGDGDLMEGINYEAASLAGTLNLDNLIVLYDSNSISLDGDTSNTFTENVMDRFKAMGWYTTKVMNGNSVNDIDKAINSAKKSGKPSIIEVKTIIGNGSIKAGTNSVHGKCLESDDIKNLKAILGVPNEPFFVDEQLKSAFHHQISERSTLKYDLWSRLYNEYKLLIKPNDIDLLELYVRHPEINILNRRWIFNTEEKEATRDINNQVMSEIAKDVPNFIGGSADLGSSTKTYLRDLGDVKDGHYEGRNIWFGVREHGMGAILNGLALTGFKVYGSTFLSFADYMKPAIRMSALMNLPVNYIFTHDSINIGPDGPTHQPIEQLAMLRSTPNLNVFRPADANELVGCWQSMLNSKGPNALILSRQREKNLTITDPRLVCLGGYPIRKEKEILHGIIIATGTEVHVALLVAEELYEKEKIDLRVVSMPCQELFLSQSEEFRKKILPMGYKTIVIEAGSSFGWHRFVYNEKYLITLDNFGVSGTRDEVLDYCNFSYEKILERIKKLFK